MVVVVVGAKRTTLPKPLLRYASYSVNAKLRASPGRGYCRAWTQTGTCWGRYCNHLPYRGKAMQPIVAI